MWLRALVLLIPFALCAAQHQPAPSRAEADRAFAAAQSMLESGKVAGAAKALERLILQRPDMAEAHFALGVADMQIGKTTQAAAALRTYLKLRPSSPDGHAVLGILLFGDGRIAEARQELEQSLRLDRSQLEAAKTLGRIYVLEGKPTKSIALLRPLVASRSADDDTRVILARSLLSAGEPAAAGKILDQTLAANPRSPLETYILAAMAARDTKNIPKALDICERGARIYPNSEKLESLAVSLPLDALIARTTQRFERLKQDPNNAAEMIAIGRIMTAADKGKRSGALELGEKLLARAANIDPENALAWYQYGRCLVAQMKPDEALSAHNKALSFVRDDELRVLILGQIGFVDSRRNRFDAAGVAFQKSLEVNRRLERHSAESAFLYYKFLVARDREDEWSALLDEISRWQPFFAPALLERAKNYLSAEQPQKAAEAALLVSRNTEDPEMLRNAHYLLVKIYGLTGNEKEAQVHAEWIKSHQTESQ